MRAWTRAPSSAWPWESSRPASSPTFPRAREVGTAGLALILYEGGLQTSWRRLREVAVPASLLSTIGVIVSTAVTGIGARLLFDLSWLEAMLIGAVVSSTDAAAVFATLRSTHIGRRVARTLEAESGGNDPMAIALTLGLIAWIQRKARREKW
jgi:potassium/hydrogen antiporter